MSSSSSSSSSQSPSSSSSSSYITESAVSFGGFEYPDTGVEMYGNAIQDADEYDPDTWTGRTDLPSYARGYHTGGAIGPKLFTIGGVFVTYSPFGFHFISHNTEYESDTYTSRTALGNANAFLAGTSFPDVERIAVFGGAPNGGSYAKDTDIYEIDTWTAAADMPSPARGYHGGSTLTNTSSSSSSSSGSSSSGSSASSSSSSASSGPDTNAKGYSFGGFNGSTGLQDTDEYDIRADSWQSMTSMPSPARDTFAVGTVDNTAYVMGGNDGTASPTINDHDSYNQDTWTGRANIPSPKREAAAAAGFDSKVYLCGGLNQNTSPVTVYTDTDELNPGSGWTSKTAMPSPSRGHHTFISPNTRAVVSSVSSSSSTSSSSVPSYSWISSESASSLSSLSSSSSSLSSSSSSSSSVSLSSSSSSSSSTFSASSSSFSSESLVLNAPDSPFVGPILLVEISIGGSRVFVSNRPFDPRNTFDGQSYEPALLSWSSVNCGSIRTRGLGFSPGEVTLEVANDVPIAGYSNLSNLLASEDWLFNDVDLTLVWEDGIESSELSVIFRGQLEAVEEMDRRKVNLLISDRSVSDIVRWPVTFVNTSDYPNADPDDVGKMLPQVWGSCKRVPARAVQAGWKTSLVRTISSTRTIIEVTDATGFPSSGVVQIAAEKVQYTGKSGGFLTGCSRGHDGTEAVEHSKGETTAEILSDYFYLVADHPVRAIRKVYVEGVLQDSSRYSAYTGRTGDQHPTYGARAVVAFSVLPELRKQINLDVEDTVDVDDTVDFADPGHRHDGQEARIEVWRFDTFSAKSGYVTNPYNWYDGDDNSAVVLYKDSWVRAKRMQDHQPNGVPGLMRLCMKTNAHGGTWGSDKFAYTFCGLTLRCSSDDEYAVLKSEWEDVGVSYDTWEEIVEAKAKIEVGGIEDLEYATVAEAWAELKVLPSLTVAGIGKTGAVVKTGTAALDGNSVADTVIGKSVSADVDGYADDATGSATGTPSSLVERPDHVFRHWLTSVLGYSSARYDDPSYQHSGGVYKSEGWSLAVCLVDPPDTRQLFRKAARMARSMQFWHNGSHHLVYLSATPTTDETISGHRIEDINLEFTPRGEMFNSLTGLYTTYWSGFDEVEDSQVAAVREVVTAESATSIAKYGTLKARVDLAFISEETWAQAIVDWMVDESSEPRLLLRADVDLSYANLKLGQIVEVDETDPYVGAATLGLVSGGDQFRILSREFADFTLRLVAVKV